MTAERSEAPAREIRAVAFDLGNVLIDFVPEETVLALARTAGIEREAARCAYDAALAAGLKRDLESGAIAPAGFRERFRRFLPLPDEALDACWCAALRPRSAVERVLARLRPGPKLALWSNTDPIHFARIAPEVPAFARLHHLHLSYEARVRKPARAFFEAGLAALGAAPAETLFLDDSEENLAGARALGIEAVHVATVEALEAALAVRGLLAGADQYLGTK